MTDLTVNHLRAFSLNYLRQRLRGLAPDADPAPTALLWIPAVTSPLAVTLAVPSTLAERIEMLDTLRVAAAELDVRAIVVVASAWETISNAQGATRREIVLVTSETRQDLGGMTVFPLVRNTGAPPVISSGTWTPASGSADVAAPTGPWFGLLAPASKRPSGSALRGGAGLARHVLSLLSPSPHASRH